MEISNNDFAEASARDSLFAHAGTAPSRTDLLDVIRRLPTKEELRRVFQGLDASTLRIAMRSMKKHLSTAVEVPSGKPREGKPSSSKASTIEALSKRPPGEQSGRSYSAARRASGDAEPSSEPEWDQVAAATSAACAICDLHKRHARLARKACEHWEKLSWQVRTDMLSILLGYEKTLKRMVSVFERLSNQP